MDVEREFMLWSGIPRAVPVMQMEEQHECRFEYRHRVEIKYQHRV